MAHLGADKPHDGRDSLEDFRRTFLSGPSRVSQLPQLLPYATTTVSSRNGQLFSVDHIQKRVKHTVLGPSKVAEIR